VQLEHLDEWQQQRRDIAARHTVVVDGNPLLQAPLVRPGAIHGWHQYTIRCEDSQSFMTHFDSKGIDSRLHYNIPCHRQPVMKGHPQHPQGSLPLTELLAEQLVSIPVHPHLDENEISRIHYALADFGKI
jgi:dTDP-3-amino-3,4,6-trideoxy-alpha-D-glucose transaminase